MSCKMLGHGHSQQRTYRQSTSGQRTYRDTGAAKQGQRHIGQCICMDGQIVSRIDSMTMAQEYRVPIDRKDTGYRASER